MGRGVRAEEKGEGAVFPGHMALGIGKTSRDGYDNNVRSIWGEVGGPFEVACTAPLSSGTLTGNGGGGGRGPPVSAASPAAATG